MSFVDIVNLGKACAPGIETNNLNGGINTCLPDSEIMRIAKIIGVQTNGKSILEIWIEINQTINDKTGKNCNNDVCIVDAIKNKEIEEIRKIYFKPKRPLGERQWLSNFDISDVMRQYEKVFPHFAFYGPVASDIHKDIVARKFDYPTEYYDFIRGNKDDSISPNIKKSLIAITFNTDPHYKGGEHWVTLSIHIEKNVAKFCYFDSVGKYPNDGISKSIMKLIDMFKESNEYTKIELFINRQVHQKKNTECGVYSLNYILKCLNNESFEEIVNEIVSDNSTASTRALLFSAGEIKKEII